MTLPKRIVHPNLLTALTNVFYNDLCTIQTYTAENLDSFGQPQPAFVDLHTDVPCAISTAATGADSPGGKEKNMDPMIYQIATHHFALAAYYTDVGPKDQVVANGVTYEILLAEVDSHASITRLWTRIVT